MGRRRRDESRGVAHRAICSDNFVRDFLSARTRLSRDTAQRAELAHARGNGGSLHGDVAFAHVCDGLGDGGAGWATEFLVMATCGDKSAETTFTVTDDGSAIDPKLSITPDRISGTDFIDRDKGVHLTITECASDTDVNFEVWNADKTEKLYEQTAESDKHGTAGIQVYGLGDDPAAYAGTYAVMADCADISRDGKFVVTAAGSDPAGGGDSGEASSTGSSSMPRTGAELTGLAAGILLILAGGAAIVLARRNRLG